MYVKYHDALVKIQSVGLICHIKYSSDSHLSSFKSDYINTPRNGWGKWMMVVKGYKHCIHDSY